MKTNIESSLDLIQSPKVRAIVAKSASAFVNLMSHKETELLDTLQEVEEGKKLTISHALVLDIEKNQQTDRVAFSMRHSIESDGEIPDPDQLELPTGEEGA